MGVSFFGTPPKIRTKKENPLRCFSIKPAKGHGRATKLIYQRRGEDRNEKAEDLHEEGVGCGHQPTRVMCASNWYRKSCSSLGEATLGMTHVCITLVGKTMF